MAPAAYSRRLGLQSRSRSYGSLMCSQGACAAGLSWIQNEAIGGWRQAVQLLAARIGSTYHLRRGKNIGPEIMAEVAGTSLDKGIVLDELARTFSGRFQRV